MKPMEIIRFIMTEKSVGSTAMANRLEVSSAAFCMRFKQPNVSTDKMNDMLRVLDYKLVAVPIESRLPKGAIEVE